MTYWSLLHPSCLLSLFWSPVRSLRCGRGRQQRPECMQMWVLPMRARLLEKGLALKGEGMCLQRQRASVGNYKLEIMGISEWETQYVRDFDRMCDCDVYVPRTVSMWKSEWGKDEYVSQSGTICMTTCLCERTEKKNKWKKRGEKNIIMRSRFFPARGNLYIYDVTLV